MRLKHLCPIRAESDGMEALYADTLTALTEEEVNPGAAALVLAARPEQYAAKLAHLVTGSPVLKDGFDPVYNLLLNVAPPAALTTEGVAKAHESVRIRGLRRDRVIYVRIPSALTC